MSTLYLTYQSRSVCLENRALIIETEDDEKNRRHTRILLRDISRIVVSGSPNITLPVLKVLCRAKIPLVLMTARGRWIGELSGVVSNNAARRIVQYDWATRGNAKTQRFAIPLISAKIANQHYVLRRLSNRYGTACTYPLSQLKALRGMLLHTESAEQVRGIEGLTAAEYFRALSAFFPKSMPFVERSRRPPKNGANALLSFSYVIVLAEVESAIRLHGLDPAIGFLHSLEPGRASLALDFLEAFRPSVDAFVLSLLNRKIFTERDFEFHSDDCGTYLAESSHKKFFEHYEKAMSRRFSFGASGAQIHMRAAIDWQVCRYLQSLADENSEPEFFRIPQ